MSGVRASLPAPGLTTKDDMPRQSSEKAVEAVGNRYDLVLIASARVRELRKGHRPKVATTNGPFVTALLEIEQGHVGREYLKRIRD
jgi:DNA-directed RNA polymerase subunit omega